MPACRRLDFVTIAASLFLLCSPLLARDWYVSAARGKGKKGSIEKPAKDLGNIAKRLEAGDTVHLAGGVYLGRGKNGSDTITVPVRIIGGYHETFKKRDPWGAHRTILSGDNLSPNWVSTPRLHIDLMKYRGKEMPDILVDGIIADNAGRNRYSKKAELLIVRSANPKTQQNPTPTTGGIVIGVSKTGDFSKPWNITVQNCIVLNTGATQGALSVSGYKGSKVKIRNNLVINNTGTGIYAGTKFIARDDTAQPEFLIENNTVLFTWKFDPSAQSYSGNSMKFDRDVRATVRNNLLAFADKFGLHNAAQAEVLLVENRILGNVEADYLEFDTRMALEDIEDEAERLHEDSEENSSDSIEVPVDKEWAKLYAGRVLVDRNAAEADIKVQQTAANQIRSMLGLNVQAGKVDWPTSSVWLPRLAVEDAVRCGTKAYAGKHGCSLPRG